MIIENIRLAFRSIRGNLLRTTLTIFIIGFGIMALVGILTALENVNKNIQTSFSQMGANTLSISDNRPITGRRGGKTTVAWPSISYEEATEFKGRFTLSNTVSIHIKDPYNVKLKTRTTESNPNIKAMGVDENYLATAGYTIKSGRKFSESEVIRGSYSILLGSSISKTLFSDDDEVIGAYIYIGNKRFTVVGILEPRGASVVANDNIVLIPLQTFRSSFGSEARAYQINIQVPNPELLDIASSESTGIFRNIRRLKIQEKNNFSIQRSDGVANLMIENLAMVAVAATMIGVITLFGAAIALMNILLVSVRERTREIGVSKAIGAKSKNIKTQFLTESVVICQIGGIIGIILGILMGNIVSLIFGSPFLIPWLWIILGFTVCFITGMVAGVYPAIKASKLDPIEALRYE